MGRATVRATRTAVALALLASGAVVLGAGGPQGAPTAGATPELRQASAPQQAQAGNDCDVYQSVPPSGEDGAAVKAIKARRNLVIGVDQNSFRWGARNPNTGQIEGFDIDLARAIGTAIMGDPEKVTLKAVPTSERIKFVQEGRVDLIVRTMTITCDRLQQVAFSKPYFNSSQRVLVPKSSTARTIDEAVDGKTVCAASSSSAEDELKARPKVGKLVSVENHLDCLVLMQLGRIDATMTDDGLAASQAAQDQTVRVVDGEVRPAVMGIAMLKNSTDLTARVNQVLAEYHNSGAWRAGYDKWLKPYMLNDAEHYWPTQR
ncbi:glutamate ABC transporter substrate-binding protein [Kitasatospora sp. NBC_00458]|uniref:glutamate ABC transporter substrate-binding protein n=1 Tax=Kitasatospora sp. NBC_00458 TaxID=2903568 RepID=UPI002E171689